MNTTKAILNEWREYSEYYELFENHAYIENILGIKPLLTESGAPYYDSKTKKKIIEEHLLLEGFLDRFNPVKLAKEWGPDRVRILWPLIQIATNPEYGPEFGEYISKYSLKPMIEKIQGRIDWAIQNNILILARTLQTVKDKITSLYNMGKSWKKTLALVGGAGALAFLQWGLSKITGGLIDLAKESIPVIKDWAAKWDAVKEKVMDWIKDKFMEVLEKLLGTTQWKAIKAGITAILPWLRVLLEVLEVSKKFGDLLKNAIGRFDGKVKIDKSFKRSRRRTPEQERRAQERARRRLQRRGGSG